MPDQSLDDLLHLVHLIQFFLTSLLDSRPQQGDDIITFAKRCETAALVEEIYQFTLSARREVNVFLNAIPIPDLELIDQFEAAYRKLQMISFYLKCEVPNRLKVDEVIPGTLQFLMERLEAAQSVYVTQDHNQMLVELNRSAVCAQPHFFHLLISRRILYGNVREEVNPQESSVDYYSDFDSEYKLIRSRANPESVTESMCIIPLLIQERPKLAFSKLLVNELIRFCLTEKKNDNLGQRWFVSTHPANWNFQWAVGKTLCEQQIVMDRERGLIVSRMLPIHRAALGEVDEAIRGARSL